MSIIQQLRTEAARKADALYETEKNRRPLVWGHLCDGFEAGYLAAGTLYGTSLIAAQERIKELEKALESTIKYCPKGSPLAQIINEALSPNTDNTKEDE